MFVHNSFFFLRAATNFIDKIKEFRFHLIIKTYDIFYGNELLLLLLQDVFQRALWV